MDSFDKYKYLLGETVMLYQFMENDLKLIYAGLLSGNFYKNIEYVRSNFKGLGQVVQALEELDHSDSNPYFSKETYMLLGKLARQRNFYCHQCCVEFCYNPYFRDSFEFNDSLAKLEQTNHSVKSIQAQTEKHRASILARFKGV
ncbi:MAG: hypothetical protein IJW59_00005 [Clostridia bacterium]|nr:hypothetical protein [Clostridia bacterium]